MFMTNYEIVYGKNSESSEYIGNSADLNPISEPVMQSSQQTKKNAAADIAGKMYEAISSEETAQKFRNLKDKAISATGSVQKYAGEYSGKAAAVIKDKKDKIVQNKSDHKAYFENHPYAKEKPPQKLHNVNNSYTPRRNNTYHNSGQKKTTYHNTNQALKNNEDIESIYKFCKKICFGLCIVAVFVGGMYFMNKLTKGEQNKVIDVSGKNAGSQSVIAANTDNADSENSHDDIKQDKNSEKKKNSSKDTSGNAETNSAKTFNIDDYPLYLERVKLIAYDLSEYDNYLDLSLEDVGYNLCDLNSDGSPELIIGYMNGRENSVSVGNNSIDFDTVIQIYAVYEGSLATLAQSDQRYYICNDNTVGYWGSGGASSGSYRYYKYTNDIFMDSIGNIDYEFDQSRNESFYYYPDIYSDYYNNRKLISSGEAWKTVSEHSSRRLNYTPVSSVPATPESIEYNWLSDDSYLGFGYVNTKDDLMNLRSGQSYDSKILGRIPYGEEISILNDFGKWYNVIYHGIYGYVRKEFVKTSYSDDNYNESSEYTADYEEPADAIAESEVVTDNDILNLRSGASYDNSVLLKIPNHSIIKILSKLDEWYYVWYNGTYGYVRKEFVELQ